MIGDESLQTEEERKILTSTFENVQLNKSEMQYIYVSGNNIAKNSSQFSPAKTIRQMQNYSWHSLTPQFYSNF